MPIADDEHRAAVKRFNATLVNHLFLLYFDTRAGYGDTGPVRGARRTRAARCSSATSTGSPTATSRGPTSPSDVPYHHLTAALVLDDVQSTFTDFGTSNHTPEDYLDRLVAFGLYTTDGLPPGELRPVPADEHDDIVAAVRKAQAQHYRNIAAMDRDEKIRAGAYVYFSFLRPFAEIAGVADELDWTRAPRPARAALPAHVGDAGRERRRPRGRGLLRPLPGGRRHEPTHPPAVAAHRRRRAAPTRPGEERLWGESWYFDFTDREGTLGGYVRLGLYPNLGVAWYWACLVGEGRPLVTVIDHEVALPKAPSLEIRADGLWADHVVETPFDHMTLGCEAFADRGRRPGRGLRRPPRRPGARSASTSSGRPTAAGSTRGSAPPATRCRATCTARSSSATRRSSSTASASATTAGACATGGTSAGCGPPAASRTAPASTPRGSACPAWRRSRPGYVLPPGWRRGADRRVHGRARSSASTGSPPAARSPAARSSMAVEPRYFSPVHLVDETAPTAPATPASRGRCAASRPPTAGPGVGWTEWNQPVD